MANLKSVLLDRDQLFLIEQLLLLAFKDIDWSLLYTRNDKYILEINEDHFNKFKHILDIRYSLYEYIHSCLISLDNENKDNK